MPELATDRGYRYKLVNFACGGETTASLLERTTPCDGLGPGGVHYGGRTQIAAAERFLREHRGKVGLITVSIGGNDVTACARGPTRSPASAPPSSRSRQNVTRIAERLRKAAGKKVRIVGITYPDVILGEWVGASPNQDLARLSVVAFRQLINPALKDAYAAADGKFVDVTAATGAYSSLDADDDVRAVLGTMPVPVAKVCELTYYCVYRDIHARSGGYKLIAGLIAKTLPRR